MVFVVVVPYMDRYPAQRRSQQLERFLREFHNLHPDGKVVIIEQQRDDGRKFNRGKLLNIGFQISLEQFGRNLTHVIFHDVDLIPDSTLGAMYSMIPDEGTVFHLAGRWGRYMSARDRDQTHIYVGGALSVTPKVFTSVNGFPNNYWGWGGEDDELSLRFREEEIQVVRPRSGCMLDLENMNLHQKMGVLRRFKEWKCMVKDELLGQHSETWTTNGLNTLSFVTEESLGHGVNDRRHTHIVVDVGFNNDSSDDKSDEDDQTWGFPESTDEDYVQDEDI